MNCPGTDRRAPRGVDELLFLREMHHRLANTMTVLTSVFRRDFVLSASPSLRELAQPIKSRIVAFSNLHRSLTVGVAGDRVSVQCYVENLCKALSEAVLEPLGVHCEVSADVGELSGERCELLGLVIAELVINASKHAFRERQDSQIRVEVIQKANSWLCVVSDDGDGLNAGLLGVGSKILNQLVQTLGGKVARKSGHNGTTVVVSCPN